ncbi:MAG: TIGR02147 family protein [Proteobacteria bacterium]|nr:TIGR02147 family protein [Pseudomonadota bacterium]
MEIDIPKIRKRVKIFDYSDAGQYLKAVYDEVRRVRKSYSIADFSEFFDFGSNNTMAQVHSGHRKISVKAGERMTGILKMSRAEKNYFLAMIRVKHADSPEERDRLLALILELRARNSESTNSNKSLEFFNSWVNSVVFEVLSMNEPQSVADVCNRIAPDLKEQSAERCLNFLESIGLVEAVAAEDSEIKKYIKVKKDFSLGGAVPGLAIVRYHQEMLNLAKDSLITSPPAERDVSSVTIAVSAEQIDLIKDEINRFRKYLLLLSSQAQDNARVMQVNVQLFPLSK